ncbi:MAG TPA: cytochrome o ubiquinol oxidase subunit III [Candidatus Paceibacterota bacterium]|nr:cytochrome o ubiquinol oxidase subunit III [Candidatus Paceibacterota bacterium]
MNETLTATHEARPMNEENGKTIFGFWIYLMTDLIMFAALFATYAVLHDNTFGGPGPEQLFDLNGVLFETLVLLTSSFTCGLAMLAARNGNKNQTMGWFIATFVLGTGFLALEAAEFVRLIASGSGPQASAFLSAFFTLVGTHGLHIMVGLLWMFVSLVQIKRKGLTPFVNSKLSRLALFWHFLDLVWIFIFTIVYLMGIAI